MARLLAFVAAAAFFAVVATSNSAGYRYGVSDQAFYIPAVGRLLTPGLFPRDAALVDAQSRLLAADQAMAWLMSATGIGLPDLFLVGYLLTVVCFAAGAWLVGTALFRTRWANVALLAGLTLRHRVTGTGVNTFEGYFHPRVLTFAIGLVALGAVFRRRWATAAALVLASAFIHPTTALWFAIWIGVAAVVSMPALRRPALVAAGLGGAVALWMVWKGPLASSLVTMDAEWLRALASKDYLFPTDWSAGTWGVNAIAPIVLAGVYVARRRAGVTTPVEGGVVAGCGALLLLFVAALPFIEARLALAVQLQVSRVLWLVEFLATAYLVWALAEGAAAKAPAAIHTPRSAGHWMMQHRAAMVAVVMAVVTSARGYHVLQIQHHRSLVTRNLPRTAWQATGDWADRATPLDAHFLADQGHAWRFGISFRVAGRRDVLLEHVKDSAMALYSRDVAMRVLERDQAIGEFSQLTPERVTQLAARYDLDYLIADRPFPFPVRFQSGPFRVYAIEVPAR